MVKSKKIKKKTNLKVISLIKGSNLGPPGIATFKAFAVKNDFRSNK